MEGQEEENNVVKTGGSKRQLCVVSESAGTDGGTHGRRGGQIGRQTGGQVEDQGTDLLMFIVPLVLYNDPLAVAPDVQRIENCNANQSDCTSQVHHDHLCFRPHDRRADRVCLAAHKRCRI